jgi:hypothetical protein
MRGWQQAAAVTAWLGAALARGAEPGAFVFTAELSPAQQVSAAPVRSEASAQALISFARDLSSASVHVIASGLAEPSAAHLHCAPAGENGATAVTLTLRKRSEPSGVLILQRLGNADVAAIRCSSGARLSNLASLFAALRRGEVYLNIRSAAHPAGELRGQLLD